MKPRLLLLTPPFTQLNTPYPATAYLTGYLQSKSDAVFQADLGIETFLTLFSRAGLSRLFEAIHSSAKTPDIMIERVLALRERYLDTIDPVIRFLQGADPSWVTQICQRRFLPEGPRFLKLDDDHWAYGSLGLTDRAKHLASLYLDDLVDLIEATIDPRFGLSRYAERLATSATSFDSLRIALGEPPGLIDRMLEEVLDRQMKTVNPHLVGITVPFPGNLYAALRSAAFIRRRYSTVKIVLGGGYVNTELRELSEPRLFDFVDYVTLDAGELPILSLLECFGAPEKGRLCRTFLRRDGKVLYINTAPEQELPFAGTGTPTYRGLPLQKYISLVEMLNPMHRLWSDGRWNKLTVAHGCYWKKCAFCDIGLDYIQRYEPAPATLLANRIDAMIEETGESGFHFVDEAAPPSRLADLALELLDRGRAISWWGNIRFEEAFTPDLCRLLASSGCIAVTGGMEVASDRLLALMEKGITVAQVARVAHAFTKAGIMVHAYLMYGFPTETAGETVESLERVRQLFKAGILHSAFWHRFTATRHSPVGLNPGAYGIEITGPAPGPFANNDLTHTDPSGCDPEQFGPGLAKAIYNYMHGAGFEADVRSFFDHHIPKLKVPRNLIATALATAPSFREDLDRRLVWLGGIPSTSPKSSSLFLPGWGEDRTLKVEQQVAEWLQALLKESRPRGRKGAVYFRLEEAAKRYPTRAKKSFGTFLKSGEWKAVREAGLLLI